MVIFVKNVKETKIGVSVFNNSNFGESDVYKVDKDFELKEFRIDSNGKKSKKSDQSLKKLEIKILPSSDGELVKIPLKWIVNKLMILYHVFLLTDSSDVLFVSFSKSIDDITKKKLRAHGGVYYFIDGPSYGVKNEKFVWLPQRVDLNLEDLVEPVYDTNYNPG